MTVQRPGGTSTGEQLWTEGGAAHIAQLDVEGNVTLTPLERRAILRRPNLDGTWRWYNDYGVPANVGGGAVRVRLLTDEKDQRAKLNRTEVLRAIPPGDPDYQRVYPRRSDAEPQNRALDESLWLRRAHSVGAQRQLVDWPGFGLVTNALALKRHRERRPLPVRAA